MVDEGVAQTTVRRTNGLLPFLYYRVYILLEFSFNEKNTHYTTEHTYIVYNVHTHLCILYIYIKIYFRVVFSYFTLVSPYAEWRTDRPYNAVQYSIYINLYSCDEKRTSLEIYIRRTVEMRRRYLYNNNISYYYDGASSRNDILSLLLPLYKRHDGILYNIILTFYMYRMLQCLYYSTTLRCVYGTTGRSIRTVFFTFIPFIRMSSGRKQFVGRSHVG